MSLDTLISELPTKFFISTQKQWVVGYMNMGYNIYLLLPDSNWQPIPSPGHSDGHLNSLKAVY